MASKRDLKRTINYITSELFAETVAASLYNGNPSQEDVDGILSSIVMVNNDFIKRVSHPEPSLRHQNSANRHRQSKERLYPSRQNIHHKQHSTEAHLHRQRHG